jgi:hypothetical protein
MCENADRKRLTIDWRRLLPKVRKALAGLPVRSLLDSDAFMVKRTFSTA